MIEGQSEQYLGSDYTERRHDYLPAHAEHVLDQRFENRSANAGPILRQDRVVVPEERVESLGLHNENALAPDVFKDTFERLTGMHPGLLDENEIFYLSRLFAKADTEFLDRFKLFFGEYGISTIKLAVATEYYPAILYQHMILGEQVQIGQESIENILQQFEVVYDVIDGIREIISERIGQHQEYGQLAQQMFEAMLRKSVDLVELWQQSHTSTIKASKKSILEIETALEQYRKSLFIVSDFFNKYHYGGIEILPVPEGQMPKFLYTDITGRQYGIKFFSRARATTDGQARVNIEVDFNTPNPDIEMQHFFQQTTERLKNGEVTKVQNESVFRLSLDRDTTHSDHAVTSLDIGRAKYYGNTFNRTGDRLGNLLAEASSESTHTPHSFAPEFAEEEKFATIAEGFSQYISGLHATESQREHQM